MVKCDRIGTSYRLHCVCGWQILHNSRCCSRELLHRMCCWLWVGTAANDDAGDCIDCVAGRYLEETGSSDVSACIDCMAGKWSAISRLTLETDCIACAAGKYLETPASTAESACIDCIAGKYALLLRVPWRRTASTVSVEFSTVSGRSSLDQCSLWMLGSIKIRQAGQCALTVLQARTWTPKATTQRPTVLTVWLASTCQQRATMHRQTASLAQLVGTQTVHGARRMPIALHAPTASAKATRVRLCIDCAVGQYSHSQLCSISL